MKYKYPKKITICGNEFIMKYDKKEGGGSFKYPYGNEKGLIIIGTRDLKGDNGDFLAILVHELTEIIHTELFTRFKAPDNDSNYHFCYNHKEHTTACSMLAGLLKQFIK
jgi:hypothetical protein